MLRAHGARRSQSRPLPPKAMLRSFWRGSEPASGSPAPWVMCGGVGTLAPTLRAARHKFRKYYRGSLQILLWILDNMKTNFLNNLDSQSNYGVDVLVLLDGKEIFKNINVF